MIAIRESSPGEQQDALAVHEVAFARHHATYHVCPADAGNQAVRLLDGVSFVTREGETIVGAVQYALEQTIEANRCVRFLHIRIQPAGKGLGEAWAQLANDQTIVRLRMSFPDTEEGPKEVVWQADKAEIWFKAMRLYLATQEADILAKIRDVARVFDLKARENELLGSRGAGKLQSETVTSADDTLIKLSEPFIQNRQTTFYVDPATKLLRYVENYELVDGRPVRTMRLDYVDYDEQKAPDVFTLKPPPDVTRVDQTSQEIGLVKGERTEWQVSVELVREFFQALIVKDYAKAGRLYFGLPASKIQAGFEDTTFVRIVSISVPVRSVNYPSSNALEMACVIEIEKKWVKTATAFRAGARPVRGRPDRWCVAYVRRV